MYRRTPLLMAGAIAFGVLAIVPVTLAQTDNLTNDTVLGWIKWGIPSNVIVATIQKNSNNSQFALTPDRITELLKGGVTEVVLETMLKANIASARHTIASNNSIPSQSPQIDTPGGGIVKETAGPLPAVLTNPALTATASVPAVPFTTRTTVSGATQTMSASNTSFPPASDATPTSSSGSVTDKKAPANNTKTIIQQCNKHKGAITDAAPDKTPFNDCDQKLWLIGGVEQGAQSSSPSSTNPFLSLFTRAGLDNKRYFLWGDVRLLGAPQTSSTSGVFSAVTDPAGNITSQNFSTVGTSVDYMIGPEFQITTPETNKFTFSVIAGYGGTTPLAANTLSQAFKSPVFGTVECGTVQARFKSQFQGFGIIPGTPTNAGTTPACLVNSNSTTSAAGAAITTFTPISTLGFTSQDRSNFLGKWSVGVRTIHRYLGSGKTRCGIDNANDEEDKDINDTTGSCQRGMVDYLFGQDSSVTGGKMRHFVFKVDAEYPLPAKSVSFLYLFGSATIRFERNKNNPPLILQSGDISSLTANGATAIPNPAVIVLPLTQPDRDFYRFGVGIDIYSIYKKLTSATPSNSTTDSQKSSDK